LEKRKSIIFVNFSFSFFEQELDEIDCMMERCDNEVENDLDKHFNTTTENEEKDLSPTTKRTKNPSFMSSTHSSKAHRAKTGIKVLLIFG